jgi:hypothetical protein
MEVGQGPNWGSTGKEKIRELHFLRGPTWFLLPFLDEPDEMGATQ